MLPSPLLGWFIDSASFVTPLSMLLPSTQASQLGGNGSTFQIMSAYS